MAGCLAFLREYCLQVHNIELDNRKVEDARMKSLTERRMQMAKDSGCNSLRSLRCGNSTEDLEIWFKGQRIMIA